ncbi:Lsr2 family protein [Streptomyces sp. NPDC002730]|uniref:histone-like nucleoid-structuring protein Lsr2 n=1 Tax=Streptomyces sp. NPDC002730 TaxID=3364662 RepID=UPI0036BBB51A
MAQKVQVLLIDDLEGGNADETVTFGLDGKVFEIDLKEANADKLRELLEPYAKAGRRTGGKAAAGTRGRTGGKAAQDGPSADEMRKWAAANGYEVSTRGRVPQSVREAYAAAHA